MTEDNSLLDMFDPLSTLGVPSTPVLHTPSRTSSMSSSSALLTPSSSTDSFASSTDSVSPSRKHKVGTMTAFFSRTIKNIVPNGKKDKEPRTPNDKLINLSEGDSPYRLARSASEESGESLQGVSVQVDNAYLMAPETNGRLMAEFTSPTRSNMNEFNPFSPPSSAALITALPESPLMIPLPDSPMAGSPLTMALPLSPLSLSMHGTPVRGMPTLNASSPTVVVQNLRRSAARPKSTLGVAFALPDEPVPEDRSMDFDKSMQMDKTLEIINIGDQSYDLLNGDMSFLSKMDCDTSGHEAWGSRRLSDRSLDLSMHGLNPSLLLASMAKSTASLANITDENGPETRDSRTVHFRPRTPPAVSRTEVPTTPLNDEDEERVPDMTAKPRSRIRQTPTTPNRSSATLAISSDKKRAMVGSPQRRTANATAIMSPVASRARDLAVKPSPATPLASPRKLALPISPLKTPVSPRKSVLPPSPRKSVIPPSPRKSTMPLSPRKSTVPPSPRKSTIPLSPRKSIMPLSQQKSTMPVSPRKSNLALQSPRVGHPPASPVRRSLAHLTPTTRVTPATPERRRQPFRAEAAPATPQSKKAAPLFAGPQKASSTLALLAPRPSEDEKTAAGLGGEEAENLQTGIEFGAIKTALPDSPDDVPPMATKTLVQRSPIRRSVVPGKPSVLSNPVTMTGTRRQPVLPETKTVLKRATTSRPPVRPIRPSSTTLKPLFLGAGKGVDEGNADAAAAAASSKPAEVQRRAVRPLRSDTGANMPPVSAAIKNITSPSPGKTSTTARPAATVSKAIRPVRPPVTTSGRPSLATGAAAGRPSIAGSGVRTSIAGAQRPSIAGGPRPSVAGGPSSRLPATTSRIAGGIPRPAAATTTGQIPRSTTSRLAPLGAKYGAKAV